MGGEEFFREFESWRDSCEWTPDEEYSVFTQYDGPRYYQPRGSDFNEKYQTFWAIARTLLPKTIVELGTHAGSSADSFLSATRDGGVEAEYVGYDLFREGRYEWKDEVWRPLEVVTQLMRKRGFIGRCKFHRCDLRGVSKIDRGDLVVVDAEHDYRNALCDLLLAFNSGPQWILLDDTRATEVSLALSDFLKLFRNEIGWRRKFNYCDGGELISLKQLKQLQPFANQNYCGVHS